MYCSQYDIALSNIGRTGTEVGRHLAANPTITSRSLVLSKWSGHPPRDLIAEAHVLVTWQRFRKNISELIFRRNMLNFTDPFFDVVTKVKKVHRNMFGPGTNLVVRLGYFNTSGIVFESTADHLRFHEGNWKVTSTEFQKNILEMDDFTKSGRQSNQLGFRSTECHKGLHLETPHDGAICVGN